jgi:hypothetical protein
VSTGDPNNPDPVDIPLLRQVLDVPSVRANLGRMGRVPINRGYDIPYLAGYAIDGSEIFIDRDMPDVMTWAGKPFYTDQYLRLHETLEKSLIDAIRAGDGYSIIIIRLLKFKNDPLGTKADDLELYFRCHGCAEAYEEHAVQVRIGTAGHQAYNLFMSKHVKVAGLERIIKVPRNLDLTPYDGDPRARRLLGEMRRAMQ